MATLKVYPNGLTFGTGGGNSNPPKRGTIRGWTSAVARRQQKWLYSVITDDLHGYGYAVTLTLADLPETSDEWHLARKAVLERFRRVAGFLRLHWVTEWQRRKVPHLHLAVYYEKPLRLLGNELLLAWLEVCEGRAWRAGFDSQDVKTIDGAIGWLKYLSKHAGRSAAHYQREGMPPGWEKTGRLWGKLGVWPTTEAIEASLTKRQIIRYRRLVRAYVHAEARAVKDWRRVAFLRRYPARERDPFLSSVRGASEWIPEEVALRLLECVVEG